MRRIGHGISICLAAVCAVGLRIGHSFRLGFTFESTHNDLPNITLFYIDTAGGLVRASRNNSTSQR